MEYPPNSTQMNNTVCQIIDSFSLYFMLYTFKGSPTKSSASGLALNRRGVPARKRKRNSLIYGTDDLVSIPARSPKKRGAKSSGTPDKYNDTG